MSAPWRLHSWVAGSGLSLGILHRVSVLGCGLHLGSLLTALELVSAPHLGFRHHPLMPELRLSLVSVSLLLLELIFAP